MSAPAPASARAIARPIPRRAPVTTAVRPVRSNRVGSDIGTSAVDQDLDHAAVLQRGERLGGPVERVHLGDQRVGRHGATGHQLDGALEVNALVYPGTQD